MEVGIVRLGICGLRLSAALIKNNDEMQYRCKGVLAQALKIADQVWEQLNALKDEDMLPESTRQMCNELAELTSSLKELMCGESIIH